MVYISKYRYKYIHACEYVYIHVDKPPRMLSRVTLGTFLLFILDISFIFKSAQMSSVICQMIQMQKCSAKDC